MSTRSYRLHAIQELYLAMTGPPAEKPLRLSMAQAWLVMSERASDLPDRTCPAPPSYGS